MRLFLVSVLAAVLSASLRAQPSKLDFSSRSVTPGQWISFAKDGLPDLFDAILEVE